MYIEFVIMIIIGLLIPIIIRLLYKHPYINKKILDPYLIFLLGQIFTELLLVQLLGKGAGVIVGFLFSSMRLGQLKSFLHQCQNNQLIISFVYLQLILWSINCVQIIGNRFLFLTTSLK